MKYVLDSSTAVKWVLPEVDSDKADHLRDAFIQAIHELLAPEVFHVELAHALTRAERQKRIVQGEAEDLWNEVMSTPPQLVPSFPLMPRAIQISSVSRASVYDCLYVALAERENCEFVTADTKLVNNLQNQFPFIVAISSMP
jgi:predicted nucleic acid-binding protein